MVLLPEDYHKHSAYELLSLADQGLVAFDHRLLRVLLADMAGVARYANERAAADGDTDLAPDLLNLFCHQPTPQAGPFLAAMAGDFRDDLPEALLEALARLGAPALEPMLAVHAAHSEDPGELATALAFLKVGDPRIEAIFAGLPEEDASFLRDISSGEAAAEPFDIFALYPESAAPLLAGQPLKLRKEFLASPDATHRMAALSTFLDGKLGPGVARILERMAREDEDPEVRGVAWETLEGEAGDDKRLLAEMRARLVNSSVHPRERAGLLVALAQLGSETYSAAADELYRDRATRARALQAMWRSFNRDFAKYAIESLDDTDADIREQAILAVGYLNQASQAPRLEKLFDDETHRDTALFAYALCAPVEVTRARMKQLFRTIDELAGGLSAEDAQTVEQALDLRLEMHGLKPVFDVKEDDAELLPAAAAGAKPGRNDPCPCGSGKKYKKCHGQ